MALSLLLLCLFLSYWLTESFQKEKDNLRTQLDYEWTKAQSSVQDSMIKDFFDSLQISRAPFLSPNHNPIGDTLDIKPLKLSGSLIESIDIKKQEFAASNDGKKSFATIKIKTSNGKMDRFSQGITTEYQLKKPFNPEIRENFIERIESKNLPKEYILLDHNDSATAKVDLLFNIDDKLIVGDNVLALGNYRGYLLKKIFPQILFSLLLLIVVGFSFWQSWLTLKKQKRLSAMKTNFVSNMAHELKTPISTVTVAIEALKDFDVLEDKNKSKEYLDISKNELSRLALLVDKVLKMSQFDGQKNILKKEEDIDFLEIINAVSNSMKLQIDKYGAEYEFDFTQGNYLLKADRVHLTNVLYNLIDNALKYGGEKPKIFVKLDAFADKVVMSVKDRGVGIPKEYHNKIFERFFRVPTGDVHNTKGHGLGLSYANHVINAHGGSLYFESQEGKGSTFTIELPRND